MKNIHLILVFFAFVISGIAGLIYESIWSQYLGLYLGHAAFAQTLTLAIFMGGMALGAWLVSKHINRFKNAVMTYAIVELVLGLLGLVFHTVFDATILFSFNELFPYLNSPWLITTAKWLIASFLILPQSILLGSTFPLLSSGVIRRMGEAEGGSISMLYFSNSIGAAFGAILATFILLPHVGLPGALLVAGLLNIFVAIIIYIVAKTTEPIFSEQRSIELEANNYSGQISVAMVLVIACFTGFASFVYEITWIRMLNLVLGTTLHSFEIMLSAFILGLALGGLWIKNRIDKIENMVRYLGVIQILMGLMAVLTMPLYMESFTWVADILINVLQTTDTGYTFYNILTAVIAMLIMMPAAFFAGMTLPLLTMILMKKGKKEKAIGHVYASNTLGALFGVWFAIHIGMVVFGLKYMLVAASLLDVALGTYLILKSEPRTSSLRVKAIPFIYIFSLVFVISFADFSPRVLAAGTYRNAVSEVGENTEVVFYEDGKSASISVLKYKINNMESHVIATNGKPDAGVVTKGDDYSSDEPTMVLIGALPLLVKPDLKTAANIGFGSGITTHTLLSSSSLEVLDTIEIEPEMINGAKLFGEKNSRVFNDPRSHIHIDDAKTFFAANNKVYDVITSEPSNPWVMGVGNLFTQEFYQQIKRYLKEDGILVQWMHLYELSPEVLATVFNAISMEFKYYDLYLANSGDVVMLVSNQSIPDFQFESLEQLDTALKQDFANIKITSIDQIKSRKAGNQDLIKPLFSYLETGVNSDYFPLLSLKAPKDRFRKQSANSLFLYTSFSLPMFELIGTQQYFSNEAMKDFDKSHPYFQRYQNSLNVFKAIDDPTIENQLKLDKVSLGFIGILSHSTLCESKDISQRREWLGAFVSLFNEVIILGSDSALQLFDVPAVKDCLRTSGNTEVQQLLLFLSKFASKQYLEVADISKNLAKFDKEIEGNFKSYIFDYTLYSLLQLKNHERITQGQIDELVGLYKEHKSPHSYWFLSQLIPN